MEQALFLASVRNTPKALGNLNHQKEAPDGIEGGCHHDVEGVSVHKALHKSLRVLHAARR